jgi:hypothetical protein
MSDNHIPSNCEPLRFSVGGFTRSGRPFGQYCGYDRTRAYQTYRHFAELPQTASVSLYEYTHGDDCREIEAWAAECNRRGSK